MTGKLANRKNIAIDTFESTFSLDKDLIFNPGQYTTVTIPTLQDKIKGKGRIFSIVNTPKEKKILKIIYRNTGSTYKKCLLTMKLGEKVKISDPLGEFAPLRGELVFLAAGIGIAPFMSMFPIKATLFYSNKSKQTAPYLDKIPKDSHLIFTNKDKRLDLGLVKKKVKNWQNVLYYIAGSPKFVEDLEAELIEAKINPKQIKREAFDGEES